MIEQRLPRSVTLRIAAGLLCMLLLIGSWFLLFRPLERQRASREHDIAKLETQVGVKRQLLANAGRLRIAERRVRKELRDRQPMIDRKLAVQRVLSLLPRLSRRTKVHIISIRVSAQEGKPTTLLTENVNVRLRGRFGDVLAFLCELPAQARNLSIDRAQFVGGSSSGNPSILTADLSARLFMFSMAQMRKEME